MDSKKILIMALTFVPFFAEAAAYSDYEQQVNNCVKIEKSKQPVSVSDLGNITPKEIPVFLLFIKNKRIQTCSWEMEMDALIEELATSSDTNVASLADKYLSIFLKKTEVHFTEKQKARLQEIEDQLRGKSLEVDIPLLLENLEQNQ